MMNTPSTPPDHDASVETSDTPEPAPVAGSTFGWRTLLIAAIVVVIVGGAFLLLRATPQAGLSSKPKAADVFTQPTSATSGQTLTLQWRVVTAGPSPFNSNVWTARLELSATGGNGQYIFWVNNQRLPDTSPDQFTFESSACDRVGQIVGVTSDGQAVSQALVVHSPLPACATP
jgi:hypothetical protein